MGVVFKLHRYLVHAWQPFDPPYQWLKGGQKGRNHQSRFTRDQYWGGEQLPVDGWGSHIFLDCWLLRGMFPATWSLGIYAVEFGPSTGGVLLADLVFFARLFCAGLFFCLKVIVIFFSAASSSNYELLHSLSEKFSHIFPKSALNLASFLEIDMESLSVGVFLCAARSIDHSMRAIMSWACWSKKWLNYWQFE